MDALYRPNGKRKRRFDPAITYDDVFQKTLEDVSEEKLR